MVINDKSNNRERNDRRNSCNGTNEAQGLGKLPTSGRVTGDGSVRVDPTDCNRDNTDSDHSINAQTEGKYDLGKILSRLSALEEKYNEYVGAHQERLKNRLSESEEAQSLFNQEVSELRTDIYAILTSE